MEGGLAFVLSHLKACLVFGTIFKLSFSYTGTKVAQHADSAVVQLLHYFFEAFMKHHLPDDIQRGQLMVKAARCFRQHAKPSSWTMMLLYICSHTGFCCCWCWGRLLFLNEVKHVATFGCPKPCPVMLDRIFFRFCASQGAKAKTGPGW